MQRLNGAGVRREGGAAPPSAPLFDMHCHLDFLHDGDAAAAQAAKRGVGCLSVTVTPGGFERARQSVGAGPWVRCALGLHPWWVAEGRLGAKDVEHFVCLAKDVPFIGEIGLDFSARCAGSEEGQLAAFDAAVAACSEGGKVISIHAVRAAGTVLDILTRHSATERNACIFHWFSGSSDELGRAVGLGCYVSVNGRMLASRRGREYARTLPADRLLLETDMPSAPETQVTFGAMVRSLNETLAALEQVRKEAVAQRIAQTSARLLGTALP